MAPKFYYIAHLLTRASLVAVLCVVAGTPHRVWAQSESEPVPESATPAAVESAQSASTELTEERTEREEHTNTPDAVSADVSTAEGAADDERQLLFEEEGDPEGVRPPRAIGIGDVVRMLLVLGAVVAAIYGLFFVLKRLSSRHKQSSDVFRLHGSLSLTNGGSLHVVEIGDHLYVVGCGDHGVSLISEITDQESHAHIKKQSSESHDAPRRGFGAQLKHLIQGGVKRQTPNPKIKFTNPLNALHSVHSRLRTLNQQRPEDLGGVR